MDSSKGKPCKHSESGADSNGINTESPCETSIAPQEFQDEWSSPSHIHGTASLVEKDPPNAHQSYPAPVPMRAMHGASFDGAVVPNTCSRNRNQDAMPGAVRVDGPGPSLYQAASPAGNRGESFEAELVDDIVPLDVRHVDRTNRQSVRRRWRQLCGSPSLLVGVGVAITASVLIFIVGKSVLGSKDSEPMLQGGLSSLRPTRTPSVAPSLEPTSSSPPSTIQEAAWVSVIQTRSPSITFDDFESPKRLALDWMLQDPYSLSLDDENRIVQRFALTVMFFAMGGPSRWLASTNECEWSGVGDDLECVSGAVEKVHLSDDGLSGSIPGEIGLLTTVEHLDFFENQLSSTIPTEIGLLSSLTFLTISSNKLEGTLPSEVGLLTRLLLFTLYGNNLQGTIPSEIGFLNALTTLDLWGNSLSGTIPTEVWHLSTLKSLGFYNNSLSGTIPSSVGHLSALATLSLPANDFHGTIPTEIGLLSDALSTLSLSANQKLSGRVPSEFGQLANLEKLDLYGTQITGSIPSNLCDQLRRANIDCVEIYCDCCTAYPSGLSC